MPDGLVFRDEAILERMGSHSELHLENTVSSVHEGLSYLDGGMFC